MEKPFLDSSTIDNSGNEKTLADSNFEDSQKLSKTENSNHFVASFDWMQMSWFA